MPARFHSVPEVAVEIIDLTDEHCPLYYRCLEDWSDEMTEAGSHKARWHDRYRCRGLRVKLARDDDGAIAGMIQTLPVEHTFALGHDLEMVLCIWVHGHRQGPGNRQKRGLGRALLAAAEADALARGAKGMAAWGLGLPVWMRASWFRKHGYRVADRDGMRVLLWKPFADDAESPRWLPDRRPPRVTEGPVQVTAFINGWCPGQNITFERARRAAAAAGPHVVFEPVDTAEKEAMLRWGQSDAVFIDGKPFGAGKPPSYEKARKALDRAVRKARRAGRLEPAVG